MAEAVEEGEGAVGSDQPAAAEADEAAAAEGSSDLA